MKQTATEKRILCLHEEDYAYDQIRHVLSDKGYFVYEYSDVKEAFAHIYNEPPDIMIMSTKTKGWEEFMKRLKNDSVYKHLPLILLINEEMLSSLVSAPDLSYDDFFLYLSIPRFVILSSSLSSRGALHL